MNGNNLRAALDDADVQDLAERCHRAMLELSRVFHAHDFLLAAVARAEDDEDSFSLDAVTEHLNCRLADLAISTRDTDDINRAFERWLAAGDDELRYTPRISDFQ
jgi:hypothetical protein